MIDVDLVRGKSERERFVYWWICERKYKYMYIYLDKCGDFFLMLREIGKLLREYLMFVYFNCLNRFNFF